MKNNAFSSILRFFWSKWGLLSLILAGGGFLRILGIGFGLPDLLHLDEPFEIHRALRLASGGYDFDRAGKGVFYYLICMEIGIAFFFLLVFGVVNSTQEFAQFFIENEAVFYLMGRLTSAFFSVASMVVVYLLGQKKWNSFSGLLAALIFSLSSISIVNAHYSTVDSLFVFLLCLTFFFMTLYEKGDGKFFLLLAFAAWGFSVATKLPGVCFLFSFLLLFFLEFNRVQNQKKDFFLHWLRGVLVFIVILFVAEPGYFRLLSRLKLLMDSLYGGALPFSVGEFNGATATTISAFRPLFFYGQNLIREFCYVLFFGAFGVLSILKNRDSTGLFFLSFGIPYLVSIGFTTSGLVFSRYLLPIIPIIALISSLGVLKVKEFFEKKVPPFTFYGMIFCFFFSVFFVFLLFPMIDRAVDKSFSFWLQQPRIRARNWVINNISPGEKILMEGSPEHRSQFFLPLVNSRKNNKAMIDSLADEGKKEYWKLMVRSLELRNIPRYDLVFIQNNQIWISYPEFVESNIGIVVGGEFFLSQYQKRKDAVARSRLRFFRDLEDDPLVDEIFNVGGVSIYRKRK